MTPSTPFFYLLVEDNRTAVLAGSEPPWGRQLQGLPADGGFQMTDWHDIAHVLVRRLAGHPSRTLRPTKATVCVVASPLAGDRDHAKAAMKGSGCSHPSRVRERLLALGEDVCPGRPVAVIDGPDADGSKTALCAGLWSPRSCAQGGTDRLVRITGNAPGLQSEVASGSSRGFCRRLTVPYLAHARAPHAAAAPTTPVSPGTRRLRRVAFAAASWGHVDADAHGFVAWRKALRNACKAARRDNGSSACEWAWVSMSGNGAEEALQLYAASDFCLQPPGDTLPRPGIIDALSVGCVPVLFHPRQAELWPHHWRRSAASSVTFDWTNGAPRPRLRDHAAYALRAEEALRTLAATPPARLRALQHGVAAAAATLIYSSAAGAAPWAGGDAVDELARQLRTLRAPPDAAEAAEYALQLVARRELIAAQWRHEQRRRAERAQRKRAAVV